MAKGIKSDRWNGSLKTKIPKISIIVGAIYCKNPKTLSGKRFVPSAYNNKGVAVAIPLKAIKIQNCQGKLP